MHNKSLTIGVVVDNEFNDDIRVRKEVKVLLSHGYHVKILCLGHPYKKYSNDLDIEINRLILPKTLVKLMFLTMNTLPAFCFYWAKAISKFINYHKIDVLHVHDLYMGLPARKGISMSRTEIPLILDLHENYPSVIQSYNWTKGFLRNLVVQPKLWIRKEKDALYAANYIIVLSEHFKNDLLTRYDKLKPDSICVYPNVIDINRFNTFSIDINLKRDKRVTFLYFGKVAERRGIYETIDVFKSVISKDYPVKLLIIGPVDNADKKTFYSKIDAPEISNSIEYIPWIKVSELVSYMNISDVCLSPLLVNPQHESGVANKLFQYMYGGKPIIASNCLPQKELILKHQCGMIYKNSNEFEECVIHLTTNPEERLELGANGKRALLEIYTPEKIDKAFLNLYNTISHNQ